MPKRIMICFVLFLLATAFCPESLFKPGIVKNWWRPVFSSALPAATAAGGELITLDLWEADPRDALSLLALKMGSTIILAPKDEKPAKITFRVENVTPERALELLVQKLGLAYLEKEDVIVVGDPARLKESFFGEMHLARFDTQYVTSATIKQLLKELEVPIQILVIETNQYTLWAQGTAQALRKTRELVNAVDRPENAVGHSKNTLSLEYRLLSPTQISSTRLVELLDRAGVKLQRYLEVNNRIFIFDQELFSRWEEIESLAATLDTLSARKEKAFVYQLKNIVARDAAERLKMFDFGPGNEVKTITFNNPQFGQELLVICPPHVEGQVRSALAALDGVRQKVRAPVARAEGRFAFQELNAKRQLLSELSGVPLSSMSISGDLSGGREDDSGNDNPIYVLWVEETPDRIKLLEDLLAKM